VRPPEGAPIAASGRWLVTHDQSDTVVNLGLRDASDGTLQWLVQYQPPPAGAQPGGRDGPSGQDDAWNRYEGRITDTHIVIREVQSVRAVTLADGETVWSGGSQAPIAGIEVAGSALLVAADRLRAYEVATESQLWDYDARGARVAVTPSGTGIFVAGAERLSFVDGTGKVLWANPYPSYLLNASPDWAGVVGDLGYVTFRPQGDKSGPLDFDVIAVNLGITP
jgi:hypothetical protein